MNRHPALTRRYEFDAAIVYNEDDQEDGKIALEITNALSGRNISIEYRTPGEPQFKFLERVRWKIFILSKGAFNNMLLKPMCIISLTDSIFEDKIGVIPVLNGLTVDEIPEFINWISCVSTADHQYTSCLLNIILGEELQMDHCLPRGNISTGLMCGYIYNYLPVQLLNKAMGNGILTSKPDIDIETQPDGSDFTTRIQKRLRASNVHCGCIKMLYIHVPKTCTQHTLENAEGIEYIGELDPVKLRERSYQLDMYKFTSPDLPGGQVCFLMEQATPTTHLFDISNVYRDVGISPQDLHKQAKDFCESFSATVRDKTFIQKVGDLNSICHCIFYDEHSKTKRGLVDVLTLAIKEDIDKNVTIVY